MGIFVLISDFERARGVRDREREGKKKKKKIIFLSCLFIHSTRERRERGKGVSFLGFSNGLGG